MILSANILAPFVCAHGLVPQIFPVAEIIYLSGHVLSAFPVFFNEPTVRCGLITT